jgi:cell division protein FtsZ
MESSAEIAEALRGADIVFLTAGMGGGTGTGAAPVAAEIAKELGAVVIAVVTLPFGFEMNHRSQSANDGVRQLQPHTHTLITVPNDRLLQIAPKGLSLEVAFRLADDVLRQGVQGIAELITRPGLINVDFAHIRQLMINGGGAFMAVGMGEGEEKAKVALQQALHHPLVEVDGLESAVGALVHYTGGEDLTLHEIGEAVEDLRETIPPECDLILGATTEEVMTGRAQVILIITGIGGRPVSGFAPTQVSATIEDDARKSVPMDDLDLPAFLRRRAAIG